MKESQDNPKVKEFSSFLVCGEDVRSGLTEIIQLSYASQLSWSASCMFLRLLGSSPYYGVDSLITGILFLQAVTLGLTSSH